MTSSRDWTTFADRSPIPIGHSQITCFLFLLTLSRILSALLFLPLRKSLVISLLPPSSLTISTSSTSILTTVTTALSPERSATTTATGAAT